MALKRAKLLWSLLRVLGSVRRLMLPWLVKIAIVCLSGALNQPQRTSNRRLPHMPVRVELFQDAGHTDMPPSPIRGGLGEDVPG